MSIEKLYEIYLRHPWVQTDSRKLKPGELFFALKGENFNGNVFAKQAVENGAAYAIIDEAEYFVNEKTILVDNVLTSLQQLATYHRQQFNIPFIAITGSNGKTTTKELIHAVLSAGYRTYTTEGNLNNHIGIPLTLLKINQNAEMVVIEMGANHQKEIEGYCNLVHPTHGLITNCGKAHLEGFGSEAGVRKGKGELFDYLRTHNGTAFIMWDYDYLQEMSKGISTVFKYGTSDADVEGAISGKGTLLTVEMKKGTLTGMIKTQLVGDYNLPNVLSAIAIGEYLKVSPEKIKTAIENYKPTNSRSELQQHGTNKIILDAYNANPSSMKLAIENFARLQAEKKVLLLGAMAELGTDSMKEHEQLITLLKQYTWNDVVLVGGDFLKVSHPFIAFANSIEAREWYKQKNFENTSVLIKGSRSMKMERVLEN